MKYGYLQTVTEMFAGDLQTFPSFYGIITAESLSSQVFGLRAMRSCGIDGFAKMPLQANIFASWYHILVTKNE